MSFPLASRLKLNVDADILESDGKLDYGVVIHDHLGGYLTFAVTPTACALSPLTAEAMAVLNGMQLCYKLSYNGVEVEIDCQRVAKLLNKKEFCYAEFKIVLQDIFDICTNLKVFKFLLCNCL
uniref:RNase H type-1 domain-containing protein n=1 Tax=Cannabis sativa TaxID=3483 RepID=A0A803P0T0_CANSA